MLITTQRRCVELTHLSRYKRVKFAVEEATRTQRSSSGTTLLLLQPRRHVKVCGQHHAPVALPPGKRPGTHFTGSRVGRRDCEKFLFTGIRSPDRPARSDSLYRRRLL
jgi:hypothetical protein